MDNSPGIYYEHVRGALRALREDHEPHRAARMLEMILPLLAYDYLCSDDAPEFGSPSLGEVLFDLQRFHDKRKRGDKQPYSDNSILSE